MGKLRAFIMCMSITILAVAFFGGACSGTGTGGNGNGGDSLTAPTIEAIRTTLGANNPSGMVPGLALGAITLPECTSESGTEGLIYSIANLPSWLAFDAATRTLSLAGGATTVQKEANTATEITYTCTAGSTTTDQTADEPATASVSFVVNDLDGGGVVDGKEYQFGRVPLLNPNIGWIWLTPGNVDIYRTSEARVPSGIVVTSVGMNPTDAADDTSDFDGDGTNNGDEITNGTNIFVAASNGTFTKKAEYTTDTKPRGIAAADLNGDGNLDLVYTFEACGGVASVLLGNGDGTFTAGNNFPANTDPYDIAVSDFNGDGKMDVATANHTANNVSVLLGKGDGQFDPKNDYNVGNGPFGIAAADLDGDGDVDLAVTNNGDDTVSILLGNGDGTFPATSPTAATNDEPTKISVADLDGDGDLDLAASNYNGKKVSVLLNDGNGTFAAGSSPTVGGEAQGINVGDFNGNGDIDIATSNYGSDESVSTLSNKGDGTFEPYVNYLIPNYKPTNIATADFDGDGDLDLVITNTYDKKFVLWLGNGDGTFGDPVYFANQAERWGIVLADFNADGKLDMATTHHMDDVLFVFLNQ